MKMEMFTIIVHVTGDDYSQPWFFKPHAVFDCGQHLV
jgi:hypothetical protein